MAKIDTQYADAFNRGYTKGIKDFVKELRRRLVDLNITDLDTEIDRVIIDCGQDL